MTRERRLYDTLERIIELSSAADEPEARLLEIADYLRGTFPCSECRILIHSPQKNALTPCGASSTVPVPENWTLPGGGEVVRYLRKKQRPLFIHDLSNSPIKPSDAESAFFDAAPMTLVPITQNGLLHGVLCLTNQKMAPFPPEETRILSLVSRILAEFLRTSQVGEEGPGRISKSQPEGQNPKGGKAVHEVLFLSEASTALLAATDLDQMLYTVLTAITLGEGLGFNRAMVFLVDDSCQMLRGKLAIGPDNPLDAQRIWTALSVRPGQKLSEVIQKLEKRLEVSQFNEWVRQMNIPVGGSTCIFERALGEGRSSIVSTHGNPEEATCLAGGRPPICEACNIHHQTIPKGIPYACAIVPLWGKGRAIGAISVDNIFNHRPIGQEDVRLLELLARQTGLAIEHLMLVERIESSDRELRQSQEMLILNEKMAALRQMAADVAHAIKNPLVSIGGFARRLDKTLDPKGAAKKYTRTMIKETTRLEGILNGILDYSTDTKPTRGTHDVNDIVRTALNHILKARRNSQVLILEDLDPNLPEVCCNYQQIRQVVLNILSNAIDAMNGRGELSIKTYSTERGDATWVAAEIMDSGGGISQEIIHNIFNPFFSTRSKRGGFGLAICHRIVNDHHGSIDVENHLGHGVRFTVMLPQDPWEAAIRSTLPPYHWT